VQQPPPPPQQQPPQPPPTSPPPPRLKRPLRVPGLGQRVFDHPTVFEPVFGLVAGLAPEVCARTGASTHARTRFCDHPP
jgi:hypothetical protein